MSTRGFAGFIRGRGSGYRINSNFNFNVLPLGDSDDVYHKGVGSDAVEHRFQAALLSSAVEQSFRAALSSNAFEQRFRASPFSALTPSGNPRPSMAETNGKGCSESRRFMKALGLVNETHCQLADRQLRQDRASLLERNSASQGLLID